MLTDSCLYYFEFTTVSKTRTQASVWGCSR